MKPFLPPAVSLSRIVCPDPKGASSARRARILVPAMAIATVFFILVTSGPAEGQPLVALAPTCQAPPTGYHYYAVGTSGTGSNKGTGAWQGTWNSWSLNGHSDGFSNEAVFSIDYNNMQNWLEVGFSVGSSTIGYLNYMHPYYTSKAGGTYRPKDYPTVLPQGASIWDSGTTDGSNSWIYVNNTFLAEIPYGVQTPRWNFEETEVNYHDIWMGGGNGSTEALYYQDSSNNWHTWGFISGSLSPAGSSYYYIDTTQPSYSIQGGYGAC